MRSMTHLPRLVLVTTSLVLLLGLPAQAQEARRRWEMERQIRLDKFEQVLPRAMRDHGIDMWIVAVKENHYDPLWRDLGRGYVTGVGYYVFTDRGGDRIERTALGPSGYLLQESGAYDEYGAASALAEFVRARARARIEALSQTAMEAIEAARALPASKAKRELKKLVKELKDLEEPRAAAEAALAELEGGSGD